MTFADETANALYATVCERPECDTARLILADRLDEVGDRDLAEFIRVGCRIAAISAGIQSDEDCGQPGCYECDARRPLLAREAELREAHPEWRKCPCQACDGEGLTYHPWSDTTGRILTVGGPGQSFVCHVCGGTGDLFTEKNHYGEVPAARTVTLSRGFPASVECAAADVWREVMTPTGTTLFGSPVVTRTGMCEPTEWAVEMARCTPVTKFVVTDNLWELVEQMPGEALSAWASFREPAVDEEAAWLALGRWVRAAAYPAASVG